MSFCFFCNFFLSFLSFYLFCLFLSFLYFFCLFCLFCLFFLPFFFFSFLSFCPFVFLSFCLFFFFVFLSFCIFVFLSFLSFCPFVFLSFCLFCLFSFCHHYHNHVVNIYYHTNFCSNLTIFKFRSRSKGKEEDTLVLVHWWTLCFGIWTIYLCYLAKSVKEVGIHSDPPPPVGTVAQIWVFFFKWAFPKK